MFEIEKFFFFNKRKKEKKKDWWYICHKIRQNVSIYIYNNMWVLVVTPHDMNMIDKNTKKV